MKQNLRYKFIFIVVVILVCIYGIVNLPKSKDELIANWHKNIHLGLGAIACYGLPGNQFKG